MRALRAFFFIAVLFLSVPALADVRYVDLSFTDAQRSREIPLRVYLPEAGKPVPVIIFSHGLGGSREGYTYAGNDWAAHGYAVVMTQHHGSDDAVWQGKNKIKAFMDMRRAASVQNLILRAQDITATIAQLQRWNDDKGSPLYHRMDLSRIGMSGHSFGASTTQAVCGEVFGDHGAVFNDPRIRACLAMSPSIPDKGDPAQAFGSIARPFMVMTGTDDQSPVHPMTPQNREKVFETMPAGDKYEVVFDGAKHMTFSQRKPDEGRDYQGDILKLSEAFWDAYLKDDDAAKKRLQDAHSVLQPKDIWKTK